MSDGRSVLMISPGYPAEMPFFVRGLAASGARVIGIGDQPVDALPEMARTHLAVYWHIPSFADERGIVEQVRRGAPALRVEGVRPVDRGRWRTEQRKCRSGHRSGRGRDCRRISNSRFERLRSGHRPNSKQPIPTEG